MILGYSSYGCWRAYRRIASTWQEDPEIAFNHASVLEASACFHLHLLRPHIYVGSVCVAGKLEEALKMYKHSKQFGLERAALHIRNVIAGLLWFEIDVWMLFTGQRKNFGAKNESGCKGYR
jgi:hypothetical protein